jgi:hypothetical protein
LVYRPACTVARFVEGWTHIAQVLKPALPKEETYARPKSRDTLKLRSIVGDMQGFANRQIATLHIDLNCQTQLSMQGLRADPAARDAMDEPTNLRASGVVCDGGGCPGKRAVSASESQHTGTAQQLRVDRRECLPAQPTHLTRSLENHPPCKCIPLRYSDKAMATTGQSEPWDCLSLSRAVTPPIRTSACSFKHPLPGD